METWNDTSTSVCFETLCSRDARFESWPDCDWLRAVEFCLNATSSVVVHLVRKFPVTCGTGRFTSLLPWPPPYRTLHWASWIHSTPPPSQTISTRIIKWVFHVKLRTALHFLHNHMPYAVSLRYTFMRYFKISGWETSACKQNCYTHCPQWCRRHLICILSWSLPYRQTHWQKNFLHCMLSWLIQLYLCCVCSWHVATATTTVTCTHAIVRMLRGSQRGKY